MNILIVLAHPERQSFNGGLADVAAATLREQEHDVVLDDLYGEGFDPVERPGFYPRRDVQYFAPLNEQRRHYDQAALPEDPTGDPAAGVGGSADPAVSVMVALPACDPEGLVRPGAGLWRTLFRPVPV